MAGPNPEKGLHANRAFATPWTSQGKTACFARSDFLEDKMNTAFATGQSMGIAANGESNKDPETWPTDWPKQGRLLRVPKCVILSSLPNWTDWWPDGYFNGPRDVIGVTGDGAFVNYYYLEQWNSTTDDVDTSFQFDDTGFSENSTFFKNFDHANDTTPDSRRPAKELYSVHYKQFLDDTGGFADDVYEYIDPPSDRFYQVVGHIINPYYKQHKALLKAFDGAKKILESKHDIHVLVPRWLGPKLYQIRNFYLTKNRTKKVSAHGGAINGRPCDISDVTPCYEAPPEGWGPAYPNTKDPRNFLSFDACNVPFLANTEPGFGTNVLHLYVGHPVIRYVPGNDITNYQAWPLTPEFQYIGPIAIGAYDTQDDLLPFFNGRRSLWRDFGFDYGFANHGALGVYNWYESIYGGGAATYKDNFWKYRNFTTRLFTYSEKWDFQWELTNIRRDILNECPGTQFYFGFDFRDFADPRTDRDNSFSDCAPMSDGLKFSEHYQCFPLHAEIDFILDAVYPPIVKRIEDYYNGLEPGSAELFKMIVDKQGLSDFNVSYEGDCSSIADTGAIVAYVLDYFDKNP